MKCKYIYHIPPPISFIYFICKLYFISFFFFFNDTATTEIYTLSLHDALPICFSGQATEIDIHAREILKIRARLNEIMAHHTGQSLEKIANDTERDYFMSGEEAKEYGLIDEVIVRSQQKGHSDEATSGTKGKAKD